MLLLLLLLLLLLTGVVCRHRSEGVAVPVLTARVLLLAVAPVTRCEPDRSAAPARSARWSGDKRAEALVVDADDGEMGGGGGKGREGIKGLRKKEQKKRSIFESR